MQARGLGPSRAVFKACPQVPAPQGSCTSATVAQPCPARGVVLGWGCTSTCLRCVPCVCGEQLLTVVDEFPKLRGTKLSSLSLSAFQEDLTSLSAGVKAMEVR
jgi:hypothetical protein